ncbi:adenine deaminase [Archaeoglobus veneficus]|uniref:Adenine deaminase n=1 Tax=Archaeoglobus veneficus (strain DSM 11195 / SNP6) TaxID=693661 RepID=F2KT76_ARCVS|nr:adenine deaminase [Archaeoglobus veneficus]AEA47106.1 Adenine deaminase [Archaeoglobus veneficus SNP6]
MPDVTDVAMKRAKPDLVLSGNVFSVFTGETFEADVAICNGRIAGIGDYGGGIEVDYILPGFIDAHIHLESTLLHPAEFAKAAIPHGTTAVIADPHEIANVAGKAGIRYLIDATANLPIDFYFMAPSCVPAVEGLETFACRLDALDIEEILQWERVLGLAELMNFPGVVMGSRDVLEKIEAAKKAKKLIDGHSPGLTGRELNAYIAAGITTDHECISAIEAMEKVRRGMKVMIREGSVAKNMRELVKIVNDFNSCFFMLVSDDLLPVDIEQGHMDYRIKLAVQYGVKPEVAVRMATLSPAMHFGLDCGAIVPGFKADLVAVDSFEDFNVQLVVKDGKIVWDGKLRAEIKRVYPPAELTNTVKMPALSPEDVAIEARGKVCRLIEVVSGQIVTKAAEWEPVINDGYALPDPQQEVAKVVVVDRHRGEKKIGKGFVRFPIEKGAIASSVSHDSHNCICVGVDDMAMVKALKRIQEMRGGFVVVDGDVKAELPLPIAGLMSDLSFEEVVSRLNKLYKAARELGVKAEHPFTTLSFLALPVIPELRITDYGLVDVKAMKIVDLWVE